MDEAELQLPPSLKTWLDEGCDLTVVPNLESYARVIVIARHKAPAEERDRLAAYFWRNLSTWINGDPVEGPNGEMIEPTHSNLRHAMWMVQGLTDMEVAERFEAALPEEIRTICRQRMNEVGDWPVSAP